MNVFILASGSKGNMTYLKVGHIKCFIDAGISFRRMSIKMQDYQEDIFDVPYLLLTHEHHDHVMGLKVMLKKGFLKKIFMTKGTYEGLHEDVISLLPEVEIITSEIKFYIDDVKITPFEISHDANEPVGYVIEREKKLVLLYDTGYLDQAYFHLISGADAYILEANHHPTLLMNSSRPFMLKKRILSEKGHLSNDEAAYILNRCIKQKAIWIAAHLSEDCNDILSIEESLVKVFDDPTKIEVYYATKEGLEGIKI